VWIARPAQEVMDKLGRGFVVAFRRIPGLETVSAKHKSVKLFDAGEIGIAHTEHSAPSPGQAEPVS
jgi:hypothetical protein